MTRCRTILALALVSCLAVAVLPAQALMSKTYEFKTNVTLETGVDVGAGLRFDSVLFQVPSTLGKKLWSSGVLKAEVRVSNLGQESKKFGIAIALFDDEGRLLGVASEGTTFALKPDRQATYTLDFTNVNGEVQKATKFKIAIEPKS